MMYNSVLLIIYILVIIVSFSCLIHYRHAPAARRISAGAGVAGMLIAPSLAAFICELLISVFSILLLFAIIFGGIGLLIRSALR